VLEDGERNIRTAEELGGERQGGVDVDDVVVGQLLAVERLATRRKSP